MRRRVLKLLADIIIVVLIGAGMVYLVTWYGFQKAREDAEFGATFSTIMARQLDLEPREVFDAIIDDLEVKKVRLPVYWTDVEPEEGKYDFADYDYFVRRAEKASVKLIMAVGRKLPRWPECHTPRWASGEIPNSKIQIPNQEFENALLNYIRKTVERYKNSPAVEIWQIENEPFFKFGAQCAEEKTAEDVMRREVELVKSLDSRPVMITDSGEQGLWYKAARNGDILGITMYRQTWNPVFKVVRFPFGPGFYAIKAWLLQFVPPLFNSSPPMGEKRQRGFQRSIMVVELQAEPWGPGKLLPDYSVELQKELMNIERFRENISFARRSGFGIFYLWGVEWWYWLKKIQNDPSLWDEAKCLASSGNSASRQKPCER